MPALRQPAWTRPAADPGLVSFAEFAGPRRLRSVTYPWRPSGDAVERLADEYRRHYCAISAFRAFAWDIGAGGAFTAAGAVHS